MGKSNYNDKFNWFTNTAIGILGIAFTLYGVYLLGGTAMTQPLPSFVIVFLVIAGLFILVALYNGIRMIFAPKDDRLDVLNDKIDKLIEMHTPHRQLDVGLINQQARDFFKQLRNKEK